MLPLNREYKKVEVTFFGGTDKSPGVRKISFPDLGFQRSSKGPGPGGDHTNTTVTTTQGHSHHCEQGFIGVDTGPSIGVTYEPLSFWFIIT
jgi:hypothetical protein